MIFHHPFVRGWLETISASARLFAASLLATVWVATPAMADFEFESSSPQSGQELSQDSEFLMCTFDCLRTLRDTRNDLHQLSQEAHNRWVSCLDAASTRLSEELARCAKIYTLEPRLRCQADAFQANEDEKVVCDGIYEHEKTHIKAQRQIADQVYDACVADCYDQFPATSHD